MLALPPILPDAPTAYSATNEAAFRTALIRYFQQQRTDSAVTDPSQAASPLNGTLVKSIGGGVLGNTLVTEAGGLLTISEALRVTGGTLLGATLGVTGAVSTGGLLTVAGAATLASTLSVGGVSTLTGNLYAAVDGVPSIGQRAANRFQNIYAAGDLWLGPTPTTTVIVGSDLCNDVNGQAWSLHVPDLGFAGWEYGGATTAFISTVTGSSQVSPGTPVVNNQSASDAWFRGTNTLQDDQFDYSVVLYDCGFNVNPEEAGIYLLAPNSGTTYQVGEGITITWEKHTSGNVIYYYRNAAGTIIDTSVVGNVSTASARRLFLQVKVRGTSLAVWTWIGTTGVITPTLLGTVTMSAGANAALRDGQHQRVGLYMTRNVSGSMWSANTITFTPTTTAQEQADGFATYLNATTTGSYAEGGTVYVGNGGRTGLTLSHGILIDNQSGSATSRALTTRAGAVQFGDNTTLLKGLTVGGASTLTGAVTMASTLGVTGAITGSSTIQGTTITATTRFTGPLFGSTSNVDVVFDRNSVTQLTLGSLAATFAGTVQATQLKSTIATGTAPLTVASTTVVTNLHATNSDQLGGNAAALYALLASPVFSGTPSLPTGTIGVTQSPGNNTTALATTAFVQAATGALVTGVSSVFGRTGAVVAATNDYAFSQISGTIASGQVSGAYGGITGVGTLVSGAVPASLVTAGTFGTGDYTFPANLVVTMQGYFGDTKANWDNVLPAGGNPVVVKTAMAVIREGANGAMVFGRVNGTFAAPTGILATNPLGVMNFEGYSPDIPGIVSGAAIKAIAQENWGAGHRGTSLQIITCPTGSSTTAVVGIFDQSGSFTLGTAVGVGALPGFMATAAAGTNNTQVATTAYVDRASGLASKSVAAPTLTASTVGVMMGLALSFTPTRSTKALVVCTGGWANSVLGDGVVVQLRFGTGTAPSNAAALTGTAFGSAKTFKEAVATDKGGFALAFPVTGLTIGTTYWLDVSLAAVTGGNASITDVDILAMESA